MTSFHSLSNNKDATPSQTSSKGSRAHASPQTQTSGVQSRKLKLQQADSEIKSVQQAEEEDEAVFERILRKSRRGLCCSQLKSICCTLIFVVGLAISCLLAISIVWAILFANNTEKFGNDLISSSFRAMTDSLNAEVKAMSGVADAIVSNRVMYGKNASAQDWGVIYPISADTYNYVKERFGQHSTLVYGPDLMSRTILSNLPGYEGLLMLDSVLKPKTSQMFLHNTTLSDGLGTLIFEYPTTLPPSPTAINETLAYPKQFQKIAPLGCYYEWRWCSVVTLPYRSAHIKDNSIRHALELNFSISFLSDLLHSLTHSKAITFIMQRDDQRLVAISSFQELFESDPETYTMYAFVGTTNNAQMRKADEYPVPEISSVTKHMKKLYGDDLSLLGFDPNTHPVHENDGHKEHIAHFDLESSVVDVASISLTNTSGAQVDIILNELLLVHVIQADAFTAAATRLGITMGIVTAVIGLMSLCMVSCISIAIWRPLRLLIGQMEKAKFLQFDKINTKRFTYFSELREIQSSFYFMTQSMKQYRSFLPAHLLQTVEARLQQQHSAGKKKKRSSKIKPSHDEVQTVEDEIGSQISSDVHSNSDVRSRISRSIAPSSTASNQVLQQFHIGGMRRSITVVEVHIVGLEDILKQTALEDFTHLHSRLVETIEQTANTTKGATFNSFNHDQFLISLNSTISCRDRHEKQGAFLAMKLKERLQKCNAAFVREGFRELPLLVCVSSGLAVVSLLGSARMKHQTMHGQPLILSKVMRDSTVNDLLHPVQKDSVFGEGRVLVLIDHSIHKKLPEKQIECKQVNQINIDFKSMKQSIQIFELISIGSNDSSKDQEWLYEMRDNEKMQQHMKALQNVNSAWNFLMKQGDVLTSSELLREAMSLRKPDAEQSIYEGLLLSLVELIQEEFGGNIDEYQRFGDTGEDGSPTHISLWRSTDGMKWKSILQSNSKGTVQ